MLETDVVVVGAGAGGMTTAIIAAQSGLNVILVEKSSVFGGTTALSGGAAWIPNNHLMKTVQVTDTREQAVEYLRNVLGNSFRADKIDAFVDAAPEMLRYMEEHSEVAFVPMMMPDYHPKLPGATRSRSVQAKEYDGSRLGADLHRLRRPLKELVVFGSLQVGGADVHPLRKAFRDWRSFLHTTGLVSRFGLQLLRHGRGTRLVNGNALAGRLLRSALDAGVSLWADAPAQRLIKLGDRVTGIVVQRGGREIEIAARRGVVLASGGFGANPELRHRFIPLANNHISMQPSENIGDGIRMAIDAGATLSPDNIDNAIYCPISEVREKDGTLSRFPHIGIDRYMPGSIAVDQAGNRFVNEAGTYVQFVRAMQEHGLSKAFLIGDRPFIRSYGMGLARPAPYRLKRWIDNGYLTEAATIGDLADRIGVGRHSLVQTIEHFNENARKGVDPEFERGADALSRYRGDPENRPNPSLAPIVRGPFYAITLLRGDLSSGTGLETDSGGRVLGPADRPIPGLYAVGVDMNSISRGLYPGGGFSIGPAMTFGYLVGRELSRISATT